MNRRDQLDLMFAASVCIGLVALAISVYSIVGPAEDVVEQPSLVVINETNPVGFTVSDVLAKPGMFDVVTLKVNVTEMLDDYVSSSGKSYQQFYISDGTAELLVFNEFGPSRGRLWVGEGGSICITGKITEWNGKIELTEATLG